MLLAIVSWNRIVSWMHHADLAAEAAQLDVADVVAVDPDRAGIDVPEARQQVHQGRLAAAVGADQGDGLAVADRERDPVETAPAVRRS